MEHASDICVLLGALIIIGGLAWIWLPLGLLALGLALIGLGFVFALKARQAKASAK
jgi:Flp pilus assembly protein TadB